jgi:hypothetical protein
MANGQYPMPNEMTFQVVSPAVKTRQSLVKTGGRRPAPLKPNLQTQPAHNRRAAARLALPLPSNPPIE